MRKYSTISTRIWNDEKFVKLTETEQLLFLYILTCPHCNLIGLFILKKGYIFEDLKVNPKAIESAFYGLIKAGLIEYDEDLHLIWVKNFLKHNRLTSPNQFKAVPKIISELPKSYLINKFAKYNESLLNGLAIDIELPSDCNRNTGTGTGTEAGTGTEDKGTSVPLSSSDDADPVIPTEDPPGNGNGKGHPPDCPVLKIVERYHTILPTFSKVQVLDKTTRSNIRNRWHEDPQRWSLEWWDGFFRCVGASDFLSGRKTDFKANFTWLVGPKNFAKVLNGAYDNNHSALGPKAQRNMAAAEAVKRMIDEGRL